MKKEAKEERGSEGKKDLTKNGRSETVGEMRSLTPELLFSLVGFQYCR